MSFELDRELADLITLVAKQDDRTFSSYVRIVLVKDLQAKGLVDSFGKIISGASF